MEGFLKAYEELHPSKIDKKAAGAKIVLQHVHSVLLSIAGTTRCNLLTAVCIDFDL